MILEQLCGYFHVEIWVQRPARTAQHCAMVQPAYLAQADIDEQYPPPQTVVKGYESGAVAVEPLRRALNIECPRIRQGILSEAHLRLLQRNGIQH